MRAVVCKKLKSTYLLELGEVEKPVPGDDKVLVRIHAASANAMDYRPIQLGLGLPKGGILGVDIAGTVEAVGKLVSAFRPGDEVFGDISHYGSGGFAQYVAVPETALALKPSCVSFEDAAAIPMAGVTALQALRDKGQVRQGQKVLICGSGGGVGTFAIQLAKYFGAEVTAVCSERGAQQALSLGADHVIDYSREDFTKSGKRYDVIIAVNGSYSLMGYKRAMAPKGIYVMVGGAISQVIKSLILGPFMSLGGRKFRFLYQRSKQSDLTFIIELVRSGAIKSVIDRRYPLEETAEAMRYIAEGHARGKVIITVSDEEA